MCRGYFGNVKFQLRIFVKVYYGLLGILRDFITDIMGLFLRILLTLDQDFQKALNPHIWRKTGNWADLKRVSRNIMDITEIAIAEYHGTLRSVIPPDL